MYDAISSPRTTDNELEARMPRELTFTLAKTPKTADELTAVQREQVLDAWHRYSGELAALEELIGPENTLIEHWRVYRSTACCQLFLM